MKKLLLVAALMVFGSSMALAQEPIKLKLATFQPPQSEIVKLVYEPWAKKVEAASGGSVKIDVFAGGTLGRNPDMQLKLLNDGVCDFAFLVPAYFKGTFPDDEVFDLPFMVQDQVEGTIVAQRVFDRGVISGYQNLKVLNFRTSGPYMVHSSKPVKTPADLKGMKFRATMKIHLDFFSSMGVSTVGMPIGQVAESLSRGVINAAVCDITSLQMFRIRDATSHTLLLPLGATSMVWAMNKAKYEGLPPKAKAAIDLMKSAEMADWIARDDASKEAVVLKELSSNPKYTVYRATEGELKEWKTGFQPAVDEWKKGKPNSAKLMAVLEEELAKYRSQKK